MLRVRLRAVFGPLITLLGFGALAAVLWFGGHEVLAGRITPGQLISLMLYMMMVAGPMGGLAGIYAQFQEAAGAATRSSSCWIPCPPSRDAPDAQPLPRRRAAGC